MAVLSLTFGNVLKTHVNKSIANRIHSKRPLKIGTQTPSKSLTTSSAVSDMKREVISTDKAPAAVGPYSQAIKMGSTLYCSGQIGLDPETMKLVDGSVTAQAEQVMKNIGQVLAAAGVSYDAIVKTTVLLTDIADFKAVNEVYTKYFPEDPPARSCFAVKQLPLGGLVEIEVIASLQ